MIQLLVVLLLGRLLGRVLLLLLGLLLRRLLVRLLLNLLLWGLLLLGVLVGLPHLLLLLACCSGLSSGTACTGGCDIDRRGCDVRETLRPLPIGLHLAEDALVGG